jgi:hypothetical protein
LFENMTMLKKINSIGLLILELSIPITLMRQYHSPD